MSLAFVRGIHRWPVKQRVSNAENVSIRWHHHGIVVSQTNYCEVIMGTMASQMTSLMIIYSTVHLGADQRKHQSSASLAFEWPAQMASCAKNVYIWWWHHALAASKLVEANIKGTINAPHHWPFVMGIHQLLVDSPSQKTSDSPHKRPVPPVIGGFPSERASDMENISMWWHQHAVDAAVYEERVCVCVWGGGGTTKPMVSLLLAGPLSYSHNLLWPTEGEPDLLETFLIRKLIFHNLDCWNQNKLPGL